MTRSDAVFKSIVGGAREDEIACAKLLEIPKALEIGRVDDLHKLGLEQNAVSPDRIEYILLVVGPVGNELRRGKTPVEVIVSTIFCARHELSRD